MNSFSAAYYLVFQLVDLPSFGIDNTTDTVEFLYNTCFTS